MKTPEIIQRIIGVVNGKEFDEETEILPLINEGLNLIARNFNLPALLTSDTLTATAGSFSVPLPDDYNHSPYYVENITYSGMVNVHTPSHSLYRIFKNTGTTGKITDVAIDGVNLIVRPSPSDDQQIFIAYYKKPDVLTNDDTSIPTCIPDYLHDPLLVNYVASKLYETIGDGIS